MLGWAVIFATGKYMLKIYLSVLHNVYNDVIAMNYCKNRTPKKISGNNKARKHALG